MYTFKPQYPHARARGRNMRISRKSAEIVSAAIRNKPLKRAKRLLVDLKEGRRNLRGKYYTKAVEGMLELLESCEKNAEYMGLPEETLFVHASARKGTAMRRRRRKSKFGSLLKTAHVEMFLISRGKVNEEKRKEKLKQAVTEAVKSEVQKMKEKEKEIAARAREKEEASETQEKEAHKDMESMEAKGLEETAQEMKDMEREIRSKADLEKKKVK